MNRANLWGAGSASAAARRLSIARVEHNRSMTVRLVCIGDSFTEGMCDELRPDGHYLGWADRVALALAEVGEANGETVEYANLAVRGKLLDPVVAEQLPVAAAMKPTIATFHAGPNDVLRPRTHLADLCARYHKAVRQVGETAEQVVLFTSIGRAGGTGRVAQGIADRFARFNDNVRAVAADEGAILVDLEPVVVLSDRRLWHTDRLHLNADGHARVAAAVLGKLGVVMNARGEVVAGESPVPQPGEGAAFASAPQPTGSDRPDADSPDGDSPDPVTANADWWQAPLPPAEPVGRPAAVAADLAWIYSFLVPWLGRRLRGTSSGDGREPKSTALAVVPTRGLPFHAAAEAPPM